MNNTYLGKREMVRKLKGEAEPVSMWGKVPDMAQEVMRLTLSSLKGDLEELDFGGPFGWPQREDLLG